VKGRRIGWGVFVLPFIEQNNLYDLFSNDTERFELDPFGSSVPPISGTITESIAAFMCPSDESPDGDKNAYYARNEMGAEGLYYGKSNYIANMGATYFGDSIDASESLYWGPYARNSRTKFSTLQDGSSNTIMLGERSSKRPQSIEDPYGAVWAGFCSTSRTWKAGNSARLYGWSSGFGVLGIVGHPDSSLGVLEWGVNGNRPGLGLVSSHHPGGGGVAFGDGSVHFLSDNTAYDALQKLAMMADGNVVGDY
jgi:hypothetical protein